MSNVFPLIGNYSVSSGYGLRNINVPGASKDHKGVDLAAAQGTNVVSAIAGKVIFTGYNKDRGNYIKVDDGKGTVTLYQHLNSINTTVGQAVRAGDKIGTVGNTGTGSGPHLHFEVIKNGKNVDPLAWLNGSNKLSTPLSTGTSTTAAAPGSNELSEIIKSNWLIIAAGLIIFAIITK